MGGLASSYYYPSKLIESLVKWPECSVTLLHLMNWYHTHYCVRVLCWDWTTQNEPLSAQWWSWSITAMPSHSSLKKNKTNFIKKTLVYMIRTKNWSHLIQDQLVSVFVWMASRLIIPKRQCRLRNNAINWSFTA